MPPFIQTLLALAVSGLMATFATAASATILDLPGDRTTAPITSACPADLAPRTGSPIELSTLPVLYLRTRRCVDAGRVLPDWLTAPAALMPTGSLTWAGVDESVIVASLPQPKPESVKAAGVRDFAANDNPNLELLTAIPAPEPPTIVMAGLALAAGGLVWNQKRRRPAGGVRQPETTMGEG